MGRDTINKQPHLDIILPHSFIQVYSLGAPFASASATGPGSAGQVPRPRALGGQPRPICRDISLRS